VCKAKVEEKNKNNKNKSALGRTSAVTKITEEKCRAKKDKANPRMRYERIRVKILLA